MFEHTFFTGCNYWASASGIYMWRRWDEGNVDRDFAVLGAHGCNVLRVFPLWPDFQPLNRARGCGNVPGKVLYKDGPLPNPAGVDPEMVERFHRLCELAEKHDLRLIVGLVTGWMSGRCFIPSALEHLNPLTDPESILWQVRYVQYLVHELKTEESIAAWDLGNECNCLGQAPNRFAAWNWTHSIASAIRLEDSERPVMSGMHGLQMSDEACWQIKDQAELTDILTTHPYPLFTPNCNLEPSDGLRGVLHGTVESLLYAGVGGKPCFIEEAGSLGPGVMSERRAGRLCRGSLVTAWAHNLPGYLWWCAFRQNQLDYVPYADMALERDLGLFTQDYQPKPQGLELKAFCNNLKTLPVLPQHRTEVVVLLTRDQDQWSVAMGCFQLAKQAGFDVRFQDAEDDLQPAKFYWLPSVTGLRGISRHRYHDLMERVREGALLVASGHGILEPFEPFFGVEVDCRYQRPSEHRIAEWNLTISLPETQSLTVHDARVLLQDDKGKPMLTSFSVGAGECRFLTAPLELLVGTSNEKESSSYWRITALAFEDVLKMRMVRKSNPELGITEYELDESHGLAVVINYGMQAKKAELTFQRGWRQTDVLWGKNMIEPQGFAIIKIELAEAESANQKTVTGSQRAQKKTGVNREQTDMNWKWQEATEASV